MNKHIELVKKWLDDKESVTKEELEANAADAAYASNYADAAAADAAAHAAAGYAAYASNYAAAAAAEAAADGYVSGAKYWIKRYEELTK